MSITKRSLELEDEKRAEAERIAIKAKILKRCSCGYCIDQFGERKDAYKIASSRFARGELQLFATQKEATDMIDEVVNDALSDCAACGA